MTAEPATEPGGDEWVVAASFGQERLWFADQVDPHSPAFNIITSVRLPFALPADALVDALRTVVGRHEALRTTLGTTLGAVDAEPQQVVHPEVPVEVPTVDLRDRPAAELDELIDACAVLPIPLDSPPLWRATLARLADAEWLLVLTAHHAIFDGASIPNLRAELTELCLSTVDGRPARLPELAIQYPDFAAWQRDQLSGATLDAHLAYWRAALDGAPLQHDLPTDRPRPAHGPAPGADIERALPTGLAGDVARVARSLRATPFMVFLAAYATLVHRLSDADDVLVGVPVGGRELAEVEPLIGMFVNTVVLRVDLAGNPTFAELVQRVRAHLTRAWEYQDTPFQKVVEAVAPRRDAAVAPLFQLGFNYLPDIGTGTGNGVARDDLMLGVTDTYVRLEYSAALFDRSTADTLVDRYLGLLAAVVTEPGTALWDLPLSGDDGCDPDRAVSVSDLVDGVDGGAEVVDRVGRPTPAGVVGRGPGGELARRRPDGTVEVLGPAEHRPLLPALRWRDHVVATLRRAPGVSDATVVVEDGPTLVGYLEPATVDTAAVRAALAATLPAYLTPRLVARGAAAVDDGPTPPRTPTEVAIAAIWTEVLGVDVAGVDDDFFDVGGHSMLAVRLVARLRGLATNGVGVGVMDVVGRRTIRRLAELVDGAASAPRRLLHELTGPGERLVSHVCMPYGGGSAAVYRSLADALPDGHALFAVAVPGHDVGLDEQPLPFDRLVDECAAEILATVPGPIVLYGHCGVGGAVTVALARRLESAGRDVGGVYLGGVFPTARAGGVVGRAMAGLDRVASNRIYRNWLTGMGVDLNELEPAQADRIVANMRRDGRAAEAFFTDLLAADHPRLRAPVIAVVGERDRVTEFYQERFREWLVVSDTVAVAVIDEAGHYFLAHRADELAAILTTVHPVLPGRSVDGPGWRLLAVETADAPVEPTANLRTYLAIAAGQLVSLTGAALTQWAVPIWIYLRTGSYVSFALFAALAIVPTVLVSPLAGAVVDRLDRRRVMLTASVAAGTVQLALGALVWTDQLRIWHLYVLVVCLTTAAAFQRIGFFAATPQLVPKPYLGHANGVNQIANGFANLIVPLLAAGLLAVVDLGGILLIEVACYTVAVLVLAVVRFPRAMGRTREEPLLTEVFGGLRFTWGIPGLRSLLLFFAALNVFLGAALIMVTPLVLAFGSLGQVGQVAFAEGLGAAVGGLAMVLWGGPTRRRAAGALATTALLAACYLLVGARPSLPLIAVGLFGAGLGLALTQGIYATIVQVKVPQRFHGRVFALNQMIAWSTLPLGYAVVGPFGARLMEPLLADDGPLASTVGAVIGTGPGRGVGLLYLVLAVAMLVLVVGALRVRTLARFDRDVPDAAPDDLIGVAALRTRPVSSDDAVDAVVLHELVAAAAARAPATVALIVGAERVTYGELDARADRLAAALRRHGVGAETPVALAMDRSVTMVVATLAVLRAGGAYLALDPGQPSARLAAIVAGARPVLLLTDGAPPPVVPACPVVDCADLLDHHPAPAASPAVDPDGLAYLVFTSGSTGVPKGVLAHHRGVVNHLRHVMRAHDVTAADTVLQIASLAFDASVRDLFGPLSVGATVVLLTPRQAKDPAAMLALVRRHRVTCLLSVVPTLLRGMTDLAAGSAPSVRLVLFAGERLHHGDCLAARRLFGQRVRLVNQYGPTETTMTTTYLAVPPGGPVPDPVPLGRPIDGTTVRIIGEDGHPVPVGHLGEIHIGGVGVARGYLNAPAETAARFVPDPLAEHPGGRRYRTGDRGLLRADGTLEFHGRIDDQVKIRGQRVEPGEIEGVLRSHPGVREAAVTAVGDPPRLVGHLSGATLTVHEVRTYLRERLPDYLVPAELVILDALPRTPNGKVDRRALATDRAAVETAAR